MKTASNVCPLSAYLLAAFVIAVGFGVSLPTVFAADNAPLPVVVLPPSPAAPPQPTVGVQESSQSQGVDTGGDKGDANGQTPKSVQTILRKLETAKDEATVGDINSARQAIAKIDVLIELEKKLVELDKARQSREKSANSSISLNASHAPENPSPPPMPMPMPPVVTMPPPAMPMISLDRQIEIVRITGDSGLYRALIKVGDDNAKMVSVGDKISDDQEVVSGITPTSVTVDHKGHKRLIHINNVDMVFSGSP